MGTGERLRASRFVDSLIGSIGSLYIAIISFILIYSYVSVSLYQHSNGLAKLGDLDKLLAIRYLANPNNSAGREAQLKDLPRFFSAALSEKFDEEPDDDDDDDNSSKKTPP